MNDSGKLRRLLGLICVIGLLLCASTASAQDGSIPRPEEIEAGEELAPIRIDAPTDREQVKTPFTVSGSAPRGARLELWIGDTLDRVFQADAQGRFTAPVSREVPADTRIYVHQVGPRGQRLQSSSVEVNFTGDRAGLVGVERVDPDAAPDAPSDPTSPQPETPSVETTPEGIPRTAAVDLETLEAAPAPPPVAEAIPSADSSPTETDTQVDAETDSEVAATPYIYRRPPPNRVLRGTAEALGGFGGAVVGASLLGLVGAGFGLAVDPTGWTALPALIVGGVVGYAAGIAIGVTAIGYAFDGNGKVWAVVLGEVAGIALGGVVTAVSVAASPFGDPGVGGLSMIVFPILGAVLGYELTSDRSRRAAKEVSTALVPFAAPTDDGRWVLGPAFRLTF